MQRDLGAHSDDDGSADGDNEQGGSHDSGLQYDQSLQDLGVVRSEMEIDEADPGSDDDVAHAIRDFMILP